jgi:anti-anti-sigma factor
MRGAQRLANATSVLRHGSITIRIDDDGGSRVLRASGELDLASAPGLEHSLLHAFEAPTPSIVLDLTGVSFIDHTGLRVVMWAASRSREDGHRLRIDCGSPAVRQMIDMTGLGPEVLDTD